VLDALLADGELSGEVSLDAVGEAIGTLSASAADVEALVSALEKKGIHVAADEKAVGEANLGRVLDEARRLRNELGRAPNVRELAEATGLDEQHVRHALGLARVMQR
jgi:hypothetical protein